MVQLRYERVTDAGGAQRLCAVEEAAAPIDHPGLLPDPVDDILGVVPDGTPTERVEFELVFDGEDVVAITFVMLPTKDNTHTANANITVTPTARRRGIGRHAANRLIDRIRSEGGRKVVVTFIGAPLGTTAPGDGLAASLGAVPALESIRRALDVRTIDDSALDGVVDRGVGDLAKDYDVVQWVDHAPDDLVDRAAAILPLVFSDSPRGELDFDDEVWDAARFREYEATIHRRGRSLLATGAVERATGRLVAYTEITVPLARRQLAGQWGTIVEREHRGHRLGLLVKAENLRHLRRTFPDTDTVTTWNAAENQHMIAVNEDLGFRAVERYQAWQLTL
jgi:GNAT superfamily N-acetyltransferase